MRRPSSLAALRAILAKDLRVELRTLQSVPAMALFALTTFVLFRYGLDRKSLSGALAAGVLLATVLFAAIIAVNRLFVAERDEGGFDAIRLAPVDGTALLGAKAAALVVYLVVLEAIAVPAFGLFFLDSWSGVAPLLAVLVLVFARRTYWEVQEWRWGRLPPDERFGFASPIWEHARASETGLGHGAWPGNSEPDGSEREPGREGEPDPQG